VHLIVCLKQILDPEVPPTDFKIDPERQQALPGSASLLISIFDENALEVALQMREKAGAGKITALCLGPDSATDALRKALSMRADEAIHLREDDSAVLDAQGAARILAAAIRKLEPADLVLCGRESGDWHGGLVGTFLAAELGFPYTSFVAGGKQKNNGFEFRRQSDDGWETVESQAPAVISVTNDGANLPRIPKVKDNMMAFRKQIPTWTAQTVGLDPAQLTGANARLRRIRLYIPVVEQRCEMIAGDTPEERAQTLVHRLASMQVI